MPRAPDDVAVGRPRTADDFRGRRGRDIARDLVGTLLLDHSADAGRTPVGGLVVETEAYVNAVDPACHLATGRTARTETFFSGPGTVYVYVMHGHAALNLISTYRDHPEGILVRAIEPTHGRDVMADRRGIDLATEGPGNLASGPGKLTQALDVSKQAYDDQPLAATPLTISETDWTPEVETTARIGVRSAEDWPLRFTAADSDFVSQPAPDVDLDWDAVDEAYRALDTRGDLPTVDV